MTGCQSNYPEVTYSVNECCNQKGYVVVPKSVGTTPDFNAEMLTQVRVRILHTLDKGKVLTA